MSAGAYSLASAERTFNISLHKSEALLQCWPVPILTHRLGVHLISAHTSLRHYCNVGWCLFPCISWVIVMGPSHINVGPHNVCTSASTINNNGPFLYLSKLNIPWWCNHHGLYLNLHWLSIESKTTISPYSKEMWALPMSLLAHAIYGCQLTQ